MKQMTALNDGVLSSSYCLFRASNVLPFIKHRIEFNGHALTLFEEDDFQHYLRGGHIPSLHPVVSFEITPMFYIVDTKMKHNRKHRGFHRVTFYDGYNNESFNVFYTSKEKSTFKNLMKVIKRQGVKITYTSLNAAYLY